jgi:uncharacterized SAM-binding protein YcdF (DUF218 family)
VAKTFLRLVVIALGIGVLYLAGFLIFVETLPKADSSLPHADGIVALTGGDARLDAAVSLLEHRAAERLLITGVYETTTKDEIAHRFHGGRRFSCCADIDYTAEDTHDNAEQAADWAHRHGYRSLIVVTAQYHMPRSLAEFAAAMPHVKLIPYAVEPASVDLVGWWQRPGTFHLLRGEYDKYLAALVMTTFHRGNETESADRDSRSRKADLSS